VERYLAFWQRRGSSGPWRIVAYAEFAGQSGPEIKLSSAELSPPERQLSKSEAEATIRLRLADSSFSDEADRIGLSYAFSHTVARDGALFVGTRLVVGSEAISEALATQNRGTSITWRPVYASVASSGDLGFTVGDFISTGTGPSGAAVQRFGKYLSVWRKQSDGDWRLLMSVGNATPARAPQ
jgi:ketosteroid isomerase-like protein